MKQFHKQCYSALWCGLNEEIIEALRSLFRNEVVTNAEMYFI